MICGKLQLTAGFNIDLNQKIHIKVKGEVISSPLSDEYFPILHSCHILCVQYIPKFYFIRLGEEILIYIKYNDYVGEFKLSYKDYNSREFSIGLTNGKNSIFVIMYGRVTLSANYVIFIKNTLITGIDSL